MTTTTDTNVNLLRHEHVAALALAGYRANSNVECESIRLQLWDVDYPAVANKGKDAAIEQIPRERLLEVVRKGLELEDPSRQIQSVDPVYDGQGIFAISWH
jgi:hypothetical protein